jgi:drug/metabolite transporter (DMT)-like permease
MKNKLAFLFLFLIMLCGINTPLTKSIMDVVPPVFNVGMRFLIAFAVMFALRPQKILRDPSRSDLLSIFVISIFMVLGYIFWNVSMLFTTATNATFFACTSVLFIPFLAKLINKTAYSRKVLAGIVITVVGMYFLVSNGASFEVNPGDLLALAASVMFALQVIYTGKYVERIDPFLIVDLLLCTRTDRVRFLWLAGNLCIVVCRYHYYCSLVLRSNPCSTKVVGTHSRCSLCPTTTVCSSLFLADAR